MKKLLNLSFFYAMAAIACGVFYREFTKYMHFTGKATLAFTHVHLFVLGAFLFLILTLFSLQLDLAGSRKFKRFLAIYQVSLPFTVIMMLIRGILQVLETPLSTGADAAISGITGIAHILFTVALVFLFLSLKDALKSWETKR